MVRKLAKDYDFLDELRSDQKELVLKGTIKSRDKAIFICNDTDHPGFEYEQRLNKHARGRGCPICGKKKSAITRTNNNYNFINEVRDDYQILIKEGKLNNKSKVPFICQKHGEYWQTLGDHNHGHGCPECAKNIRNSKTRNKEYENMEDIRPDYQEKIRNGEISSHTKVPFICQKHGEYWQQLSSHFNRNQGCPECWKELNIIKGRKINFNFIKEVRQDYQIKILNKEINSSEDKVPFNCEKHGEYWQTLMIHQNHGCPKCGDDISTFKRIRKEYPFMDEIRSDYIKNINEGKIKGTDKVPFICNNPKHPGFEYWQTLANHLSGQGCPKCSHHISKGELEVKEYVENLLGSEIEVLGNVRDILSDSKKELDIYIPSLKIAIEYNGLIWHSEKFHEDKYNLLHKLKLCQKEGIRLINIFEDEWMTDKQKVIKAKIKHILNKDDSEKIYARKCFIKEVSSKDSSDFLNNNHIQGKDGAGYRYGLYTKKKSSKFGFSMGMEDILVAIMTFKHGKKSQNSKDWELSRYATSTNVVGGFGKLLKYAQNILKFDRMITFADLRFSDINSNIYLNNGFTFESVTQPNYYYVNNIEMRRQHRFNFRKNNLINKLETYREQLTEVQNCDANGYYRLFDCGHIKYSKVFD